MANTIVNTNGEVLLHGTGGLTVCSENMIHLMDFSEVSDKETVNVFIKLGRMVKKIGFLPKTRDSVSDLEILIPKVDHYNPVETR